MRRATGISTSCGSRVVDKAPFNGAASTQQVQAALGGKVEMQFEKSRATACLNHDTQ